MCAGPHGRTWRARCGGRNATVFRPGLRAPSASGRACPAAGVVTQEREGVLGNKGECSRSAEQRAAYTRRKHDSAYRFPMLSLPARLCHTGITAPPPLLLFQPPCPPRLVSPSRVYSSNIAAGGSEGGKKRCWSGAALHMLAKPAATPSPSPSALSRDHQPEQQQQEQQRTLWPGRSATIKRLPRSG